MQRRVDLLAQPLHAGRRSLGDDDVAEAVDGEAGQAVALTEHEPVVRHGADPLAQRQRDVQAVSDQRAIQRMRTAVDETRADQAVRVHIAGAEHAGARIGDQHGLARRESVQRRTLHVDLVAEHPQVTGAQAAVFATAQQQHRIVGRAHSGALRRRAREV